MRSGVPTTRARATWLPAPRVSLVPREEPSMEAQDPQIGTTLKDKWRLDALIGRGGMATVYAATHRNGKRVAVKVLNPELSRNAGVRERFVREGYLANRVGRGAVAALDDDVEDGSVFLVMELLEGETLERLRERQP